MEYTSDERLVRLWELAYQDPDCQACLNELMQARARLEAHTDRLSREEHDRFWELPVCIPTFFGRVLDLASRRMRFPEECGGEY